MTRTRYFPRYHSTQIDPEGRRSECYVVVDSHTDKPVSPPLHYHAANDYAGDLNNPQSPTSSGWEGIAIAMAIP